MHSLKIDDQNLTQNSIKSQEQYLWDLEEYFLLWIKFTLLNHLSNHLTNHFCMLESYLPRVFVDQMEDCVEFGVPEQAITDTFSS